MEEINSNIKNKVDSISRETNLPPDKPDYQKKNNKTFKLVLIILISFYVGVAWGKRVKGPEVEKSKEIASFLENLTDPREIFVSDPDRDKPDSVDFDIFWEAWEKVDDNFLKEDKLAPRERVYGAIDGMIKALDDPYSGFMDPEESRDFDDDISGSFEGIGAELGVKEGILTVVAPIAGMPAEKAGLRAGDKIIKVDDEVTSDLTIDEAVKRIRGPKGTEVRLTILRNGGDTKTEEITITRAEIDIESVIYEKRGEIAYIKITSFAEDTADEFETAVQKTIVDDARAIVLDLRNNPGGLLPISVEVASEFVPKGEVVVWEEDRQGKKISYKAFGGDSLSDLPIVVLINEGSASASEILAGVLRDSRKSLLVGEQSFGKGSVQILEDLKDGSSLRITIARWLTPLGNSIDEVGLEPDIKIEMTEDDYENERDPQLDRALEEARKILEN